MAAEVSTGLAAGEGATLLLVDDDDAVRGTTALLLRRLGYRVAQAAGGQEALARLAAEPGIALVLTDVAMPGMGGVELAQEVARRRPDLPVIFITGYADPGQAQGGARRRLLRKPFRAAELDAAIATALREGPCPA